MRSNGSANNRTPSNAPQEQGRLVFERMNRYVGRLSKSLEPENVHRFRTNSRRLEALVEQLAPDTRNKKKLLKLVSKLRKRAGKLRDLDVQIAFLKSLRMPERQNHRAQLLESLTQEHTRRTRKLTRALSSETVRELRKRLRREQAEITFAGINPLRLAMNVLPKPNEFPLTEKALHACRIAAKQARYLAELAGNTPEANLFIKELRGAQDAIGEWHDIVKLKEKAEKRFGSASESALVSMLQNVSRARFRAAGNALSTALAAISEQHRPARRPVPAVEKVEPPAPVAKAASFEVAARNAAVA
jgi:CHAD domain-containing protein